MLSTVWGTASIRDLAVEVGAVPASPIRQVLTSRQAGCAWPQSSARASLWVCGQHKSVAHKPTGTTAATENLNNLEISSVRTTPGSPSQAALNAIRHGCYDLSAIYTRVLIAVHNMLAHGFSVDMLADLVHEGPATAHRQTMRVGRRKIQFARA